MGKCPHQTDLCYIFWFDVVLWVVQSLDSGCVGGGGSLRYYKRAQ